MADSDNNNDDADDGSLELDDRERAALATWEVAAPPAGFADRAVAGPVPLAPAQAPRRSRAMWIAVLAGAVLLATSGALLIATRDDGTAPIGAASGAVTAGERRTVAIGGRGVVVAEPGAVLAWSVDTGGAARVEHGAGAGFYRVDHGRPFVVTTPLGEVTVTGTCFRIEVIMRPTKHTVMSGAIGATLAAAVVVTVYEGGVVVAGNNRSGSSVKVAPGERATLTAEGAPTVAGAGGGDIAPPMPSATRDQLLARDELQRQRIAGLTARVGELERTIAEHGGGDGGPALEGGRPWNDPSPEQLAEWAKKCKVRFDVPPIMGSSPFTVGPERATEYGLADGEIDPVNRALFELHKQWADRVRAIYVDVVGEAADSTLSAQAMMQEIEDKSPAGARSAIQARIAQERAGLVQPPADWSNAPPIERLFRSLAAIGDEAERAVAKAIGPERAHALRAKDGGWPAKMEMSGCDDPDDN